MKWHSWLRGFNTWTRIKGFLEETLVPEDPASKIIRMKQRFALTARSLNFVVGLDLQKDSFKEEAFKNRVKKSLMATWEYLDADSDEEEASLALMASTSADADSIADVDNDDEVFVELTCEELIIVVKDLISNIEVNKKN